MSTAMMSRMVCIVIVIGKLPPLACGMAKPNGVLPKVTNSASSASGRHLSSLSAQVNQRWGTTP